MANLFDGIKKIHLIGIGGIGMSGIAEYLTRKKYTVTGSDMNMSPVTRRLEKFKIKITEGHKADNLPEDTELVIYSAAVKEDNPELQKALNLKIRSVKRAEALGNIVNDMFVISVSGTHGKTTTTAMIAKVLIDNKIDPTVFVGGNIDFLEGGSSRIGKSNIAVVEADEYDRSFYQLNSDIIVITNIDTDHLDIFKDLDDIKSSFRKFTENGKEKLNIIACGDDKNVRDTLSVTVNKKYYGFEKENEYRIEDISFNKNSISYRIGGDEIRIKVLGRHNILNSGAAYLVTKEFGISQENFTESMKTFFGVKRRLELKYDNKIRVYDDYAHHPYEIKATLEAVKQQRPERIITVFQPHLYSRTRDFYKEFGEAFEKTDILILAKIYPAREDEIKGITSELILDEYNKHRKNKEGREKEAGYYLDNTESILNKLEEIKRDGDVIIFQGAGDVTDICTNYVKRVKVNSNFKVPL